MCLAFIECSELIESAVQVEQNYGIGAGLIVNVEGFVELDMWASVAALVRLLASGEVNQDLPHQAGTVGEELVAVGKLDWLVADQAQEGFIYKSGGLKEMTFAFASQPLARDAMEFSVDDRRQALECRGVAFTPDPKQSGQFGP